MKITMSVSAFRRVLGLGDGDETFPEFIARRIRVAELARAVVNHAITVDAIAQALPGEAGQALATDTAKNVALMVRGWCGNEPRPIPIPLPWPWPPIPDPSPWRQFGPRDFAILGSELVVGAELVRNQALKQSLLEGAEATFAQFETTLG